MRSLKFRAWDKKRKRMFAVTTLNASGAVSVFIDDDGLYLLPAEQIELMQYTGLKDRNGKEIYEGDILQGKNNKIYEVSFSDGYTKFESNSGSYGGLLQGYIDEFEMRIIGNIHENPELLEEEE